MTPFRKVLVVGLASCGCVLIKDTVLPHGVAVFLEERLEYADIDPSNDLLRSAQKIFQRFDGGDDGERKFSLILGPETVILDPDGTIFVIPVHAQLLQLTDLEPLPKRTEKRLTAKVTLVVRDLGGGRPLGARFTRDGEYLYIADAHLGLTRIRNPKNDPHAKVEIVASKVHVPETGEWSQIRYSNDVSIGPKTGKVYFTDSSDIGPDLVDGTHWDTLHASKLDLMRGKGTGRLLEYDPTTERTTVLATGFKYANGVAVVDPDENFVMVAETFGIKLHVYHLRGPRKGDLDVVLESKHMTGYLDGADCAPDVAEDGTIKCYATVVSAMIPLHKLLLRIPDPIDRWLRTLIMTVPRKLAPKTKKYGGVIEVSVHVNARNGSVSVKAFRYLQDPKGADVATVSGVTYRDRKLYLGTLTNEYIAVYTLEE